MARPPRRPSPRALAFALVVVGSPLPTILIWSGLTAPVFRPVIATDNPRNFAGETVSIGGTEFIPAEVVTLQVAHADGGGIAPVQTESVNDQPCESAATAGAGLRPDLSVIVQS